MAWRGVVLAVALLAPAAPAFSQTSGPANPFSPALTVNSSAITHYDIAQRMRLIEALGARGDTRTVAIDQLTEDRVKMQAAADLGIELPEGAAMTGIEEFASQRGLTVDDVFNVLAQRDIDRQTMDDFVEAGLLWRDVVQARFRQKAMPSEADLDAALSLAENTPVDVVQFSEIALPFGERGEEATLALADRLADQLARGGNFGAAAREYSRSGTAPQGGMVEPVAAAQLPPAIRSQLLLLEPGGVTRPIPISGGVAILKLNALRQEMRPARPEDVTDEQVRNQLREQVFTQRITSFGQGYLQELLRDALIVER